MLDQLIEEAFVDKFGVIVERDMPLQKSVEDKNQRFTASKVCFV